MTMQLIYSFRLREAKSHGSRQGNPLAKSQLCMLKSSILEAMSIEDCNECSGTDSENFTNLGRRAIVMSTPLVSRKYRKTDSIEVAMPASSGDDFKAG